TTQANVTVHIPLEERASVGQFAIVRNLSGSPLNPDGNGPKIYEPVETLERAMRSGNEQDANNGFLVDLDTPVDALAGRLAGVRIFAGYAGWGAGQLEEEIEEGAWYVVPAEAGDLTREDAVDLARDVLRRQPGELAWHSTRPADPDLN
ncbi:MAG: YqgE/AlgH family protein, partial [Nocardioides sp.]